MFGGRRFGKLGAIFHLANTSPAFHILGAATTSFVGALTNSQAFTATGIATTSFVGDSTGGGGGGNTGQPMGLLLALTYP